MSLTADGSGSLPEDDGAAAAAHAMQNEREASSAQIMEEARSSETARPTLRAAVEIVIIIAWAIFLARDYLDFSPTMWPSGREFGLAIQSNYIWSLLPVCGDCVFWNGFINGGSPAFADLYSAVLHPLVFIPTLIWGGINGAKVAIIGALAMAGIGQWWLAKAMRLGLAARLWAGMIAVAGGHLAGRMEIGVVAVVISTAAASLVIAAGVDLAITGRRRSALLLGVTLALAIVSGQGYLQLGLLLGILPAFLVLIIGEGFHIRRVWREFALACGIALLLAAVFLLPMFSFWPNFAKDLNWDFVSAQTMGNTALNLVITDLNVYLREVLGAQPYPYQYITFIGWIPVLLAILALRLVPRRQSRLLLFFIVALVLVYMLASATTLRWISLINADLAAGVRVPSLIAGLAVPLVLGMAAWSVDLLLKKNWPITISEPGAVEGASGGSRSVSFNLSWIVTGILLILSLRTAYTFSHSWLMLNEADANSFLVVDVAQSKSPPFTQWTEFPSGDHYWTPIAAERGLKSTNVVRPWKWKDRELPEARLTITRDPERQEDAAYLGTWGDAYFLENSDIHYAYVETEAGVTPCEALALGGHIDVTCSTPNPGTLIVQEYLSSGWTVERDGQPVSMDPGSWLNTQTGEGTHAFRFRYRPLNVYFGIALTIAGIALCFWIWFSQSDSRSVAVDLLGENSTET